LEKEETQMIKPFAQCPVCGGGLVEKDVEKILRGGSDTAAITVRVEICTHCGERLYSEDTIRLFEDIRAKLQLRQTKGFHQKGKFYEVA
jgi:YgiT-type zinc finger domain-containing protein